MSSITSKNFAAKSIIFKEGDAPDGVYFIASGNVEISRNDGGNKVLIARLGVDSVFGEMALIDNSSRSATVMAIDNVECLVGTKEAFTAAISKAGKDVEDSLKQMAALIREKNKLKKASMTKADILLASTLKQKSAKLKQDIDGNATLQGKLNGLDPFVHSVFNSLLKVAIS